MGRYKNCHKCGKRMDKEKEEIIFGGENGYYCSSCKEAMREEFNVIFGFYDLNIDLDSLYGILRVVRRDDEMNRWVIDDAVVREAG